MEMGYNFLFKQNCTIYFGNGYTEKISDILLGLGSKGALIACDPFLVPVAEKLRANCSLIKDVFSAIQPNPQIVGVMKLITLMALNKCDTIIALGGGSVIDTAKFAKGIYNGSHMELTSILRYFRSEASFPSTSNIKIIAVPTTAGTGAEVTSVSVISHGDIKNAINSAVFLPDICLIDPSLTMTVPPKLTMITGIDALSHALESYWNTNHQPLTDMYAKEAVGLIFANLEKAYNDGSDKSARENMSYAALLAGLAFAQTKTAGCHACSYPLSMIYRLPHGEACAFTLAGFAKLNNDWRLEKLAMESGFSSSLELAQKIVYLQRLAGLKVTLQDAGISETYHLAKLCIEHSLMRFNPVQPTIEQMQQLFLSLGK